MTDRSDCPMCHGLGWVPEPPSKAAHLQAVADVYRAGFGAGPTKHVAATFGIAHRTAGLWVQQARRAGLLPETTRGRKSVVAT